MVIHHILKGKTIGLRIATSPVLTAFPKECLVKYVLYSWVINMFTTYFWGGLKTRLLGCMSFCYRKSWRKDITE